MELDEEPKEHPFGRHEMELLAAWGYIPVEEGEEFIQ